MSSTERVVVVIDNEAFRSQIGYAFNQLFSPLGVAFDLRAASELEPYCALGVVISYGEAKPTVHAAGHLHIYAADLFGSGYLQRASLPLRPLPEWEGVPVIYAGRGDLNELVVRVRNTIETNIDLVAGTFFMLTRYEEAVLNERDRFERFPAKASLAVREGFIERPIVNEYIDLLGAWLESLGVHLRRARLWGDSELAVCCTHDVDRLRLFRRIRPVFGTMWRAVSRRSLTDFSRVIRDLVAVWAGRRKDPFDTFDEMLHLEHELGFRSAYYFTAGGTAHRYDNRYQLSEVFGLIERIREAGGEIGLHGSFDSYADPGLLRSEKEVLETAVGHEILGNRQHYLRWRTPLTWRLLEEAGIKYDTTLGYAEYVGFRCGTCYPFRPYDLIENRVLGIWEIPLVVMDGTLRGSLSESQEAMLGKLREMIDTVARHHGVFVMLWHNSSFYEMERPGLWHVYGQTLRDIRERRAFCATPKEVLTRWRQTVEEG